MRDEIPTSNSFVVWVVTRQDRQQLCNAGHHLTKYPRKVFGRGVRLDFRRRMWGEVNYGRKHLVFKRFNQGKTPLTATAKRVYSHVTSIGLRPRSVAETWPAHKAGLFRSARELRRDEFQLSIRPTRTRSSVAVDRSAVPQPYRGNRRASNG